MGEHGRKDSQSIGTCIMRKGNKMLVRHTSTPSSGMPARYNAKGIKTLIHDRFSYGCSGSAYRFMTSIETR